MTLARIVIAGGPRTGKTTLAAALAAPPDVAGLEVAVNDARLGAVLHTDDLAHLGWSEASAAAAGWFDAEGPWVVEGVAAARALRKWLAAHPEGAPCDLAVWLEVATTARTRGQITMAKGCLTVWREILPELARRGVRVTDRAPSEKEAAP